MADISEEKSGSPVNNIGKILCKIRKTKKLKQKNIAPIVGIVREYMSDIDTGKKVPRLETLQRICVTLEIPLFIVIFLATEEIKEGEPFHKEYKMIKDFVFNENFLDSLIPKEDKKKK